MKVDFNLSFFGVVESSFCVMILGQISYLDCIVFLFFLAPQLLLNINIFALAICIGKAVPFVCKSLSISHTMQLTYKDG